MMKLSSDNTTDFKRMRSLLLKVPASMQDELFGELEKLEKEYNNVLSAQQQLPEIEKRLKKLTEPPLQHGIILAEKGEDQVEIGLQGIRYDVALAVDEKNDAETLPGREALISKTESAVVKVLGKYDRGESAEVSNVLGPIHPPIELPSGESTNDSNCSCYPKDCKHYRRLHVRCGNSEGLVVEASDLIQMEEINIGDIVRVDVRLAYAFDKLPSFEAGPLLLESDPNVGYEDIGGLDNQIEMIHEAIELPYLHRELFAAYHLQRPKGILLYGPPGCGKTMIAKAIATDLKKAIEEHWKTIMAALEILLSPNGNQSDPALMKKWLQLKNKSSSHSEEKIDDLKGDVEVFLRSHTISIDKAAMELERIKKYLEDGVKSYFLNVKGPELLDKYVGETEHKIRKVFDEAKRVAGINTPVVIFFDEMEAMFQARGSGISSDVEKTIVPQLLAEMDGVEGMENVIVIGASNRADLIDPAILRPGRLDIKIKIDQPNRDAGRHILRIYLLPEEQKKSGSQKGTQDANDLKGNEEALPEKSDHDNRLKLSAKGLPENENLFLPQGGGDHHRELAEALIDETVDLIYSAKNSIHVTNKEGISRTYPLSNFVSGAILNGIVSRAKKSALRRRINHIDDGAIKFDDLYDGVRTEFEENAEQMIRNLPEYAKQETSLKVVIGKRVLNKWEFQRPRPYQDTA